jgi:hypothetical protein
MVRGEMGRFVGKNVRRCFVRLFSCLPTILKISREWPPPEEDVHHVSTAAQPSRSFPQRRSTWQMRGHLDTPSHFSAAAAAAASKSRTSILPRRSKPLCILASQVLRLVLIQLSN